MLKLQKIKRKDLDLEKYSKALREAMNYRIYAEYWYLDIVAKEKWECWVYGDYEVVMPIPLQFKFGIKFVLQPIYCQQLGVFYKEEISDELFRRFEQKLHQYRVRSYCFNEENTERYHPQGEKRVNYVLNLNRPYEEVFAEYRKDKRKNIRKGTELVAEINMDFDLNIFKELINVHYPTVNHPNTQLFELLHQKNSLIQMNLKLENEINNCRFFIHSKNRIIIIASARNKEKSIDFSSFLIDEVIKKWANKKYVLDFEGSMIKGVADFNSGFGAEPQHYTVYSNFSVDLQLGKRCSDSNGL